MRDAQRETPEKSARTRTALARIAGAVFVVELVVLAVVVTHPKPSADSASVTRPAVIQQSAPPAMARRSSPATTTPPTTTAPPTTVPPAPPTTAPPVRVVPPPPARPPAAAAVAAPAPVRAAGGPSGATRGIMPPANPPVSIAPQPNFLASCSAATYDDSGSCVGQTLAAIDNGRRAEALPGMSLPSNWAGLTSQEQLFVATNLERTVRGLPPLSSLSVVLDQAATAGAAVGDDPSPPGGFPFTEWGANWAGGMGSPLEAVYYWMYDDGPGSSNADCGGGNMSGCWGHRDKILMALACTPCVMGAGFAPTGWGGQPSWAELLVATSGSPAAAFTWLQEAPYLS
jgi:hypothetical protein